MQYLAFIHCFLHQCSMRKGYFFFKNAHFSQLKISSNCIYPERRLTWGLCATCVYQKCELLKATEQLLLSAAAEWVAQCRLPVDKRIHIMHIWSRAEGAEGCNKKSTNFIFFSSLQRPVYPSFYKQNITASHRPGLMGKITKITKV